MLDRDEMEFFLEAMATGSTSRAIENQEKRGQGDFVASDMLPKKCPRTELETLGFTFGQDVDDLFIQAKLPFGWNKVATDHSMWSNIVDDKGRIRAAVFYKAAFYDRSAHMHLERRYSYGVPPVNGYGDNYNPDDDRIGQVTDCGTVIYKTSETAKHDDWKKQDALEAQVKAWLEEHYSDYKSPLAYWD